MKGVAKVEGEIWPSTDNTCEDCTCINGEISCYKRSCPKLGCKFPADPNPSNGECCPSCLSKSAPWALHYVIIQHNVLSDSSRKLLLVFHWLRARGSKVFGLFKVEMQ